jgi:uncharacterized protein
VDPDFDELAVIKERYAEARGNAPVVLVVTTTMDCNLGCYYCYESRSSEQQRVSDVDELVASAAERLDRGRKTTLHIDWYGGEPLLNVEFLERASYALQELCRELQVVYHASIVSNGTRWPVDVGDFVARHRLREVQISFDGLRENHDRRRRYRAGYRRAEDGVDRGWFDGPYRCKLVVAKLSAYSERSAFMRPHELTPERFDQLQATARDLRPPSAQDDQDIVAGFPHPRTSVCGALAPDSAVVGADGLEYRCGLQVGETHRAVGRIRQSLPIVGQPQSFADREWWEEFDPTTLPTCSRCSFLPVCWGGCPKRHLDGSRADVDAEGRFWRRNLPGMIAAGLRESIPHDHEFSMAEQFRG